MSEVSRMPIPLPTSQQTLQSASAENMKTHRTHSRSQQQLSRSSPPPIINQDARARARTDSQKDYYKLEILLISGRIK